MNALGMATVMAHWEIQRRQSMTQAHACATAGRPALQHLRAASRCEARMNKLARLTDTAAQTRIAA